MSDSDGASIAAKPAGRGRLLSLPLTPEAVNGAVIRLAWPCMLENFFQMAMDTVNMIMVARLGAVSIAGIGTATQLLWVFNASIGAVTTGTTVMVARAVGAGRSEEGGRVVKQSLILGLLISIAFAMVGLFLSDSLIALLGVEAEVAILGGQYLRVVAMAGVFLVSMFVMNAALRGSGDTRTPMAVTGGINLVNATLAYIFIFGRLGFPAMGVSGAAWAVTISRGVGTAVLLVHLLRGRGFLSIRGRQGWTVDFPLVRRLLRLGLPSMAEQLLMSGGMLIYGIIAISLGTVVYASQRITFQVLSISFMPGMALSIAATAIVGQYLGAKRPDLAEHASWYALKVAVIWMSVMGLAMVVFGRPLMRLFTHDPQIIEVGNRALQVIALSQPFMAIGQVMAGSLRGAGDTRFPMVATFLGVWLIRLPLGYLFGPILGWGLPGIYMANVLDGAMRALFNFLRYRTGRWRNIQV